VGLRTGLDTEYMEKNPLPPPGIEPRSSSQDTILTELPQFLNTSKRLANMHKQNKVSVKDGTGFEIINE
jgi:hypothetical protein